MQAVYEQYQNDPRVRFILVSVDDDPVRLDRYVAERQFAMPVARMSREVAEQTFGVIDTPMTFYIDPEGVIRYEIRGMEPHGDARARVTWYIEELKKP